MEKKFIEVSRSGQIITYTVSDKLTELSKQKQPDSKKMIEGRKWIEENKEQLIEFMKRYEKK